MKTRACAYLRCSTSEQAESGLGLDSQRARIIAYAALYDVEIVRFESDAGISGSSMDRAALQSALASLRDGTANALLVAKLDRLTRSVGDLNALLADYFSKGDFALLSVGEQFDTRSAAGRLVLNILTSIGQWEREVICERTTAALAVKRARGERVGGIPYGKRADESTKILLDAPNECETIALARGFAADGCRIAEIGRLLTAGKRFPRQGRHWSHRQIATMLA